LGRSSYFGIYHVVEESLVSAAGGYSPFTEFYGSAEQPSVLRVSYGDSPRDGLGLSSHNPNITPGVYQCVPDVTLT